MNPRPLPPQGSALTRLRYTPFNPKTSEIISDFYLRVSKKQQKHKEIFPIIRYNTLKIKIPIFYATIIKYF